MSAPPPAKRTQIFCPINELTEPALEEIFKRLPPYDRLIVSEVCRRWHDISRKAWLDIKALDLSQTPGKHIRSIVNQCPNLETVLAVNKPFWSNELTCLAKHSSLSRVLFFGCQFELKPDPPDIFQNVFSDDIEHASWTEFTLHDVRFGPDEIAYAAGPINAHTAAFDLTLTPASLTHLQLSTFGLSDYFACDMERFLAGLDRLQNLECFILHMAYARQSDAASEAVSSAFLDKIGRLKNLRELCLGPALVLGHDVGTPLSRLVSNLPKLEVLFLNHVDGDEIAEDLRQLIQNNSILRILVLSESFLAAEPIELPARKRFPAGLASGGPLPLLYIFVGSNTAKNTRFAKSAWDAARVHPITEPMPEFLERVEIARIFDGVWIAQKIKESAKHGGKLWDYASDAVSGCASRQRRNSCPV